MKTKQRIDTLIDAHIALRRREKRDRIGMENEPDSEGSADSSPSPVLPDCPFCFAPLPEGMRHSCVPLRGRIHADPNRAFYYNSNGEARLVRVRKGWTPPADLPGDEWDYYPRAHDWNSGPK
jgi:hypothetical protein